jgi:DNA-binding MurR/RpiR family transcriptional regulator
MASFSERVNATNLTAKERFIAETIMRDLSKTAFYSGMQLAKECGVSQALVTRFSHKLGYKHYSDLKSELEAMYRSTATPYDMFQHFISEENKNNIIHNSIATDIQNIVQMERILDHVQINKAVETIEKAKTVYLAAMFDSESATQILAQLLWRLDKPYETLYGVGLSQKILCSDIGSKDLLIAVSNMRILREVFEAAEYAKSKKATVIAITDNEANVLAGIADYALIAPVTGMAVDHSHVATLAMFNLLAGCLASRQPAAVSARLKKVHKRWNSKNFFYTSQK